jgi:tetratricopeptide (TPR) repeat protein
MGAQELNGSADKAGTTKTYIIWREGFTQRAGTHKYIHLGGDVMKNRLLVLMLVTPLLAMAAGTESTPEVNSQNADFAVGTNAVANQNWQAAVEAFSRALKSDPHKADIHNYLGYSYRHQDKMELSFKHYNEALKLEPNHRGAHEYIGMAYLKMDKLTQAEQHLARLESICGKSCEEYGDLSKAIAAYKAKNKS